MNDFKLLREAALWETDKRASFIWREMCTSKDIIFIFDQHRGIGMDAHERETYIWEIMPGIWVDAYDRRNKCQVDFDQAEIERYARHLLQREKDLIKKRRREKWRESRRIVISGPYGQKKFSFESSQKLRKAGLDIKRRSTLCIDDNGVIREETAGVEDSGGRHWTRGEMIRGVLKALIHAAYEEVL